MAREPRLRLDGQPDGRSTRWDRMTLEERRAATAAATAWCREQGLDGHIRKLVAAAPALNAEQRATLAILLNTRPGGDAE